MDYWLWNGNEVEGPYTKQNLLEDKKANRLLPEAMVRSTEGVDWKWFDDVFLSNDNAPRRQAARASQASKVPRKPRASLMEGIKGIAELIGSVAVVVGGIALLIAKFSVAAEHGYPLFRFFNITREVSGGNLSHSNLVPHLGGPPPEQIAQGMGQLGHSPAAIAQNPAPPTGGVVRPTPTPSNASVLSSNTTEDFDPAKLLISAEAGNVIAARMLGKVYLTGKGVPVDYPQALKWLQMAASHGDALAENNLGVMYSNGLGVQKDDIQAFNWFQKAAEQGNPIGEFNVSGLYFKGEGVKQDYSQAFSWCQKSATQSDPDAEYALGVMYENGQGTAPDLNSAKEWYGKAAAQGQANALAELKRVNTSSQ